LLYSQFVWRAISLVMAVSVLAPACGRQPGPVPPPPQQSLALGPDPALLGSFVRMDDPAAVDYIVADIGREPGFQRWAFRHPELKFRVKDAAGLKFTMEIAIPEVTFRYTGPVTISAAVNGKGIGAMRCGHAGDYRFERPVPAGAVDPDRTVVVTLDAEPRWTSPSDGAQLSFLLRSAGFTQ
jgi:hypothetical protein